MAAGRTYAIQIINNTGVELSMQGGAVEEGAWRRDHSPPLTIPSDRGSTAYFATGASMGTKGWVVYAAGSAMFRVGFDNPENGPANSSVSCTGEYSASKVDVFGNDATVSVTFSKS
jgi:hypothetical protein